MISIEDMFYVKNNIENDIKKDEVLKSKGFIVFRINSNEHSDNYYDLTTLNPILDNLIIKIKIITGSL